MAVLISGGGSNMAAIARACTQGLIAARIVQVIADRASAGGIELARGLGLTATLLDSGSYPTREAHELAIAQLIEHSGAGLIALAGYMRVLGASFVRRYTGRVLNIHPSLLPKYKGLHTHRRALQAHEREHGASVHFVTAELDGGPLICQARVPVLPDDSEQTLAARVLTHEHRIYPKAVGLIADGRIALSDDRVLLDGQPLLAPLNEEDTPAVSQARHA
ncbi:MAG TPA: phosphoribosylglycinamide formyltransferase [Steroidobacteraceae bacterium]|nr:phosphoribosylglycinamide formyltransferase [Steroidobacteraceae bacterium]